MKIMGVTSLEDSSKLYSPVVPDRIYKRSLYGLYLEVTGSFGQYNVAPVLRLDLGEKIDMTRDFVERKCEEFRESSVLSRGNLFSPCHI